MTLVCLMIFGAAVFHSCGKRQEEKAEEKILKEEFQLVISFP